MTDELRQGLTGLSQLLPKLENFQHQLDWLSNIVPGMQAELQRKASNDEVVRINRVVSRLDEGSKKKAKDEKDGVQALRTDMVNSYGLFSSHLEELGGQVNVLKKNYKELDKKLGVDSSSKSGKLETFDQRTTSIETHLMALRGEMDRMSKIDGARLNAEIADLRGSMKMKADVTYMEALNNNFRTITSSLAGKAELCEVEGMKHHLDVLSGNVKQWIDAQTISEEKIITELNSLSGAYEGVIQHARELDSNLHLKADGRKFDALIKDFLMLSDEMSPVIRTQRRLHIRSFGVQSPNASAARPHVPAPQRPAKTAHSAVKDQPTKSPARPQSARSARPGGPTAAITGPWHTPAKGAASARGPASTLPLKGCSNPLGDTPQFGSRPDSPTQALVTANPSSGADLFDTFAGASERALMFAAAFSPLIPKSQMEERLAQWRSIDYNGNGQVSFAECDKWVKERVTRTMQDQYMGDTIWRAFRPAILCAFKDAADVSKSQDGNWIQRSEFRVACAYFAIYGLMYDAFSQMDGKGGSVGSDANDDRRMSREEWMSMYSKAATYGFAGLQRVVNDEMASAVFDEMDADRHGMVLLREWCAYLKKQEEAAGTAIGAIFKIEDIDGKLYC